MSSTSASTSAASDEICAVCMDSLALKRTVTLHPCNHRFHRTCILQWFEAGKHSQSNDFTCVLCRTETDKTYDEMKQIVPRIFPFELSESFPEYIRQLPDHEEYLVNIGCQIFQTIANLREERKHAKRNNKNEEFIDDVKEELNKMKKRADAVEFTFATLTLEENTEFKSMEEEKDQLMEELVKIRNGADKRENVMRIEDALERITQQMDSLEEEAGDKFYERCMMAAPAMTSSVSASIPMRDVPDVKNC